MAQLQRSELHDEIDVRFPNNTTELITPPIVRAFLHRLVDSALLAASDGNSPNARPSLRKEFRFFRKADRDADPYGGACFETDLDWSTCCAFTVCLIEFYRESDTDYFRNQELVCVYDSAPTDPTHKAYVDGSFKGVRNSCKFVPLNSAAAQLANIPVLDPAKTNNLANTVVQYTIGGEVFLYKAVVAGGPFPAPTNPQGLGTADWQAVARFADGQLNQYSTLALIQDVLATAPDFVPALRYDIAGDWNSTGDHDQVVYVQAATATTFEAYGTLETGPYPNRVRTFVAVDVVAGTAVPVTVDLSDYAKKQDIANLIGAAPAALDTLAEIASQLKADEQGAAAMLATQQQHTQQIATKLMAPQGAVVVDAYGTSISLSVASHLGKWVNINMYNKKTAVHLPAVTLAEMGKALVITARIAPASGVLMIDGPSGYPRSSMPALTLLGNDTVVYLVQDKGDGTAGWMVFSSDRAPLDPHPYTAFTMGSSIEPATGEQVLTTAPVGRKFQVGQRVRINSTEALTSGQYVAGAVTAYNAETGDMRVTIDELAATGQLKAGSAVVAVFGGPSSGGGGAGYTDAQAAAAVKVDGVTVTKNARNELSAVVRNDIVFRTSIGGDQSSGEIVVSRLDAGNYTFTTSPGITYFSVTLNNAAVAGGSITLVENDVLVINCGAGVNGGIITLRS